MLYVKVLLATLLWLIARGGGSNCIFSKFSSPIAFNIDPPPPPTLLKFCVCVSGEGGLPSGVLVAYKDALAFRAPT